MKRARQELADIMRELALRPGDEEVNDAHVTVRDALALFTPPPPAPGCVYEERIFGRGGEHDLDLILYRPEDTSVLRAAVVFVHGGGLRSGFPEMHAWQAQALAAVGYVAVSIDYRVYPETRWPGSLEDVKCAVRWLRAHASELGVDTRRVGALGGSAGGYLAALLALTPGRFEGVGGHGEQSSEVAAAALFYPLTDTTWPALEPDIVQVVSDFVGDVEEGVYQEASPTTYAGAAAAPPFLILTGDRDREVPVDMVRAFHRQLVDAGTTSTLHVFPERAHAFDFALPDYHETFALVRAFFDEQLQPGG